MRPISPTMFAVDDLAAPAWASELPGAGSAIGATTTAGSAVTTTAIAPATAAVTTRHGSVVTTTLAGERASLVSIRVEHAVDLSAEAFEAEVVAAYQRIRETLSALPAAEPVRFWNHLPIIHQPMDAGRDRYMVFNAGRFRAFCDWFGGAEKIASRVPTASGVGHRGTDLVVHCLALPHAGQAVENPRQVPSFKYSKRYGPLPPCFARATIVRDLPAGPAVLVGGTASICGERSVHEDELDAQFRETLANLASLVTAASITGDPLAAFDDVRIYYPRPQDAAAIEAAATKAFSHAGQLQLIQADLCRSELRVEIEGVARM